MASTAALSITRTTSGSAAMVTASSRNTRMTATSCCRSESRESATGRPTVTVGRPVALSLDSDLQQEVAVMRVFLDDAVTIAADPDVVLVIDKAAVDAIRQNLVRANGQGALRLGV